MPRIAPDIAVLVGRFQPFHNAHFALLRRALAIARECVVVIGSAHQARTPKNPFTWAERAEMIRLALDDAERARVRFLPVRDYYDAARWGHAVRDGVAALVAGDAGPSQPVIALVGHFKDATSEYLRGFPDWTLVPVDRITAADGTHLRDALFAGDPDQPDSTLAAMVDQSPATTTAFLRAWLRLPFARDLAEEWRMLQQYKEAWRSAPYPPVFVTVDAVVRCADQVLLIRRGQAPGRGLYAVPGGFIEQRETAYQSALRELAEETHLRLLDDTMRRSLRETAVFDHPDRSLRGRTITHAHYFDLGERELPEVRADDDAQSVEWMPITSLCGLEDQFHDDHFHMLDHFLGLTTHDLAA
ncbi:MAG: bifunctional nicotinamide-nucleotide adenylyltransferase/Nudix hydroxylase [Caldimonas sp.]